MCIDQLLNVISSILKCWILMLTVAFLPVSLSTLVLPVYSVPASAVSSPPSSASVLPLPPSPPPMVPSLQSRSPPTTSHSSAELPPASLVPTASPPALVLGPCPPTTTSSPPPPADVLLSPVNTNLPPPLGLAPLPGCCTTNMMVLPDSSNSACQCVYPIEVAFQMENTSSAFTNLTSLFQHELASQLDLKDVQVQIQAFQFGTNFTLDMSVDIGPLVGLSFSPDEIRVINSSLMTHSVHFSSTLFGSYTVVNITAFMPPPLSPAGPLFGPVKAPSAPHSSSQGGIPTDGGPLPSGKRTRERMWFIIGVGGGTAILVLVLSFSIWRCIMKKTKDDVKNPEAANKGSSLPAFSSYSSLPHPSNTLEFSLKELQEATNDFSPSLYIGEGGFGKVYRGVLKDGTEVAIKRLISGGNQGDKEFLVEVEMLSRLHHRNLVKLLGYYCSLEPLQQLLCYELVPNGSLEAWLHGPLGQAHGPLDWNTRMKIALGAARGLAYLHEDSQPCVIHRDFKASNILLEDNFNPKVADFGLARLAPEGQQDYVSTRVMGTFGYVAPEYAMTGHLLVKSDVYSYGVVLLELLSGRKPVDYTQPAGGENITAWARPLFNERHRLHELADPSLVSKYPLEDFIQVATIAAACVAPQWNQRPTMGEVVHSLKLVCQLHEYGTSSEVERGMSSEGEKEGSVETSTSLSASKRSFATTVQMHRPTLTTFGSEGSSSTFSSGPFSRVMGIENDILTRTSIISEDLHEGR
ncbi:unnamed protein product [Sphagnum troendelagicum]|uniref:Protein kinase domain-containing protein n=1 Tax=Sphagnum troendelagicum TaxID=128251 RepID=A0ABP0UYW2_9BRYO